MSYIAEQNVIGALLVNQDKISEIYDILKPEMFTSELLGRIYHEFLKGYDNHYSVNLIVLEQKIRDDKFQHGVVLNTVRQIMNNSVTSAGIGSYAKVIVNDYKASRLNKFLSTLKATPNNYLSLIKEITEEIDVLNESRKSKSKTLAQVTKENKDKYFRERDIQPINLGFQKLDDLLGGLEGGDMIVIGARPAVGKSAFVTQITSYLAKNGKRVGFYNLEMQDKQVYERFVVSESGIGLTRLRRAKSFLGDEKERFDKANETLEKAENIVLSTGSKSMSEIRNESRHMEYDIIIIDYLQLLKSDTRYRGNRTAEVGDISKSIKALAMELNIPIIALSQMNRVSEMRDTKEPTMAELREAGDIEQDASIIILMWNLDQDDRSRKGCKIEKHRQGQTGKVVLNFNGNLMRFVETDESIKEASNWKTADDMETPFD